MKLSELTPTCVQLIGVPGSGKTTWVETQTLVKNFVVASTDDYVEQVAKDQGKTYNEVFHDAMKTAVSHMMDVVNQAKTEHKNIIWDQTNMTVGARRKKFAALPNYRHIAVVFKTPDEAEHKRRLDRPGKTIPPDVIASMAANFQPPTKEEGFAEIIYVN